MIRNVSARLTIGVVGALLGVMLLGSASVTAANTRIVCFDTPSSSNADCSSINRDGTLKSGVLVFSPVTTAGGNSAVNVQIRNDSPSTLNHVKFAGGDVADGFPYNPLFPKPAGTSFPAGATVPTFQDALGVHPAIFPSTGCSLSAGNAGFLCDFGSLASGQSATYLVVITPPASGHVWLTSSWNEGWSTTGANADYAFAEGNISVGTASCSTPTANYFLPTDAVGLVSNGGAPCKFKNASETGNVNAGGNGGIGGNGTFGSLGIDGTPPPCPSGIKCYGTTVSVVVNGGQPVSGGVDWVITWFGINSLTGVVHYLDNYVASDPSTYVLIPLTQRCSVNVPTNCVVNVTTTKTSITVEFITPTNGKGGGWI